MDELDDVEAVGLLNEPLRRRLYEYVTSQGRDVSRQEAADAVGAQRTLVAFHLDKLVAAGLLTTTTRRLTGRAGPGAGRPAKLYRRSDAERQVSLPPRDYRMLATLLADVADEARLDDALQAAARAEGRAEAAGAHAERLDEVVQLLASRGYAPRVEADDARAVEGAIVRMGNCPFHALSESHPGLVCGMNLALLEGLFEGNRHWAPRIEPSPTGCCTVLRSIDNAD